MRAYAKVKHGAIVWSSDRTRILFLQKAEGKDLVIAVDDEPTSEMRRYFEGAVVPAFFYLHPHAGWLDFKECRESVKFEFLPGWTRDVKGKRIRYARATSDLGKEKFREFLDKVTAYLRDNFQEILDPEEYKAWRDSGPMKGEVYPQHQRLKDAWTEARKGLAPGVRRGRAQGAVARKKRGGKM